MLLSQEHTLTSDPSAFSIRSRAAIPCIEPIRLGFRTHIQQKRQKKCRSIPEADTFSMNTEVECMRNPEMIGDELKSSSSSDEYSRKRLPNKY
jgi:hypothetical protein